MLLSAVDFLFVFVFFLMLRRPPRSTLLTHSFPTRRSSDLADQVDVVVRPLPPFGLGHACHFKAELDVAESGAPREELEGLEDHAAASTGGTGDVAAVQEDGATIDRKSTRLNSSH